MATITKSSRKTISAVEALRLAPLALARLSGETINPTGVLRALASPEGQQLDRSGSPTWLLGVLVAADGTAHHVLGDPADLAAAAAIADLSAAAQALRSASAAMVEAKAPSRPADSVPGAAFRLSLAADSAEVLVRECRRILPQE